MEPKIFLIGLLLAVFSSSCKAPAYLPETEDIGAHPFGSHITVNQTSGTEVEGELIAIDSTKLLVLTSMNDRKEVLELEIKGIESFTLRYAQPKNHGWTIPVYTLVTLTHGYWLIFTAPANIVVTSIVTARATNAFQYSEEDMTFEDLKMFARFPQGIPQNVSIVNIE